MVRRLPDDPDKRRLQVFKRFYQHLGHFQALREDRGMDDVIPDPETGEEIYIGDLMVGIETLPRQQRRAFELICLKGYTEGAARDEMLPNSKSSTPVQQYADSGLVRMVHAYDLKQAGQWPPSEPPPPPKKTKRRTLIMAALHPIVRQGLEASRNKLLAEIEALQKAIEALRVGVAQVDSMLNGGLTVPEETPKEEPKSAPLSVSLPTPEGKPKLEDMAKQLTAAAVAEG